ncbi:MAG TPA: hypothetical protein VNE59_12520 [Burkholderiales bacterium]|nr:hypothetical protein [Burkholderiales bacterium]
MNAKSKLVDPLRGMGKLVWPLYAPGTLLQADDLTQAVEYTRDLSRLMFRTLFGCGVLCGLRVDPAEDCGKLHIGVGRGVALDCRGDPVEVPDPQDLCIDVCGKTIDGPLWVVLRRIEKCCAPRTPVCGQEDDEEAPAVCTREREGFEIRVLVEKPECACGCEPRAHDKPTDKQVPEVVPAQAESPSQADSTCKCADPGLACYDEHYAGECGCNCCNCDCEWIVLALVERKTDKEVKNPWVADHRYRRFVRPVLMRDPAVNP